MTPERLNQIESRLTHNYTNADVYRDPLAAAIQDVDDILDYIDLLHEDLRVTRAERDAEKKKNMTATKEHALPEGARTMPDGAIRLGNRNYLKQKDTK